MSDSESWLQPFLAKHTPDVLRVFADLVEAGLRNGECSANDIRDVDFAEPNIIGASMKGLRALGFVSTGKILKSTKPNRHAGMILKWRLEDRRKAEEFLEAQRRMIGIKVAESRQHKEELFDFSNHAGRTSIRNW